jgi:hypothetical protein
MVAGRFLAAAILLATVFAGCVTKAPPADGDDDRIPGLPDAYSSAYPRLRCLGDRALNIFAADWGRNSTGCNHEMTPKNLGNEVTIAVNPTNPLNVIGGAKDYTQPGAGQCVWDGIYTTLDGGKTWKNQQLPGSNWKRLSDSTEPVTALSKHWCATDPVVAFGPHGEAYYAAMGYQCDPVSASPTGAGTVPQGGFNDWAFNCVQMYVLKSTDGGLTWPTVTALEPAGEYPATFHDRPWLAVDPKSGTVYIGWITALDENWFYHSPDGVDWEGPIIVSQQSSAAGDVPGGGGQGTMIAPGPDGMVVTSWDCAENTKVAISHDYGRTWDLPVDAPTHCNAKALYEGGRPRVPDAAFPAVDHSDGPYQGNLYFAARTDEFGHADIGFLRSRDGGKTWDPLQKLNDDSDKEAGQFFAAIGVNPNGVIDVVWYDQRNDPAHHTFDLYYTYSLDGGDTWAPNARVTEVASAPEPSHHQNGMVFIGDYIDIDSSIDYAHPVWLDTRNGVSDVYTAWIERPSHPIGG